MKLAKAGYHEVYGHAALCLDSKAGEQQAWKKGLGDSTRYRGGSDVPRT
jgi:hypothetical protein